MIFKLKMISRNKIDGMDEAILAALTVDLDVTNARLGETVGLSPSAVHRRICSLRNSGLIIGCRAIMSDSGRKISGRVFVEIVLADQRLETMEEFEAAVLQFSEIVNCHLTSGPADYRLQILILGDDNFERFHREVLSQLPGVRKISSHFVIRTVKSLD